MRLQCAGEHFSEGHTSHYIADAAAASAVQNAEGDNTSLLCNTDGAADRGGGNVRAVAVTVARVAVVCTPRKVAPALPGPRCMKKPHDASVYVMPNLLFHCLCYTGILYHSNHTMQAPATLALS